jgi:hypothetical protein
MVGLCSRARALFDRGRHRQQGRGRLAAPRRLPCGCPIVEDVARLVLARGHHRHHRFHKPGALRAVAPKAALAPAHAAANGPLGRMAGRLHLCLPHERPQGLPPLADLPTRPFRLRDAPGLPRVEPPLSLTANGPPRAGATRVRQCPLADPRLPVKPLTPLGPHGCPHRVGGSTPLNPGLAIPPQMRPAARSTPGGIPGVRTPALRDQPSPQAPTQELSGHLPTARPQSWTAMLRDIGVGWQVFLVPTR